MTKKTRVLIVDDSAFMRKAIEMMIVKDPSIEIVGQATNGKEGVEKVFELKPDVITMDIEMPQLDGLSALRQIMEKQPTPVIMVSSLTTEGAHSTLDALELGAVDFIPKKSSFVSLDIVGIESSLMEKIKYINAHKRTLMARYALKKGRQIGQQAKKKSIPKPTKKKSKLINLVAIGTSTGGPPALQSVLKELPRTFPTPIVIVQHMPPTFTKSLADRLNSICQISVKEAEAGESLVAGQAYIAPGDRHLMLAKVRTRLVTKLADKPDDLLHKPSVDVLMSSVAEIRGPSSLGVIMTGMGSDGVLGMRKMKTKGSHIIAQDEESCVVYGMPRAVVDGGLADFVVSLEQIPAEIMAYF